MDNEIIPPHLNAEVYRTDTTGTNTHSYLDYVKCHTDGAILLGCSELTGRYWNGGASILFENNETQDSISEINRSIDLASGTADGCFVGTQEKVLLCDDNGGISLWSTNCDPWKMWSEDDKVAEHDDAVLAVDCLEVGKNYVTVGADGHAKVWDIGEMICVRNYMNAHTMAITGVSVRPQTSTNFATSSLDQYISLFDDNIDKPVSDLVQNDCGVRCLQWLDENQLIFGDDAGVLRLLDLRKLGESIKLNVFPAAIHKIANHFQNQKVAICCDNKIVSVYKIKEELTSELLYQNRQSHSSYIRGLAWDVKQEDVLYTSGWDGLLKAHKVPC